MKLLILHLSDMHFRESNNFTEVNVDAIVSSLQENVSDIKDIIIIISGDLAFSGLRSQYEDIDKFLESLKEKLCDRYHFQSLKIVFVPGNHDVDYNMGSLTKNDLKQIEEKDEFEARIPDELKKMRSFLDFSKKYGCFKQENSLIDILKFNYGQKIVQINLINSGAFSSLEEDQGFHYIRNKEIEEISENQNSDFVFTVMHHPHHWYSGRVKKVLEKALYEKNDMLFCGHEHYESQMSISGLHTSVIINEGGMLCNAGNWDNSQFYIYTVDLDNRLFTSVSYQWDKTSAVYCSSKKSKHTISKNRANSLGIGPKEEYVKALFRDDKYAISDSINDYFVFPLLQKSNLDRSSFKDINNSQELFSEIEASRHVCIQGGNDEGKTTLAKFLFKSAASSKVVIYLESENIRKASAENIIRDSFERIYSDEASLFEKYKQLPSDEKVIIIDDTNNIPEDYFESFLQYTEENYGYIILFSRNEIEFDIIERLNERKLKENYSFFRFCPFYKDRREKLVKRIVSILVKKDKETQDKIIETITETLASRKNDFIWNPDFIVQFTKYYCNNVGETIQNDGSIYSKVFESNLTSLIQPHLKRAMTADKAFYLLDKVAYQMHTKHKDPIGLRDIDNVIRDYNEDFGSKIDTNDFLNMVVKAGILRKNNGEYSFVRRNYLAYFVAREIRRRCLQEGDYSDFMKALEYSCFQINADVVLFVTYITDSLNLITKIMDMAEKYTNGWESFSANPIKIKYLADADRLEISSPTESDKIKSEEAEIEQEKEETEIQKSRNQKSAYNYDEGELKFNNMLLRSVSLMNIISRVLPNFEHMMPKKEKERCVSLIYNMPLEIFNAWAIQVDSIKIALIEELKNLGKSKYRNDKFLINDNSIVKLLRIESLVLLLDLMNNSITDASKENTYQFLDDYNYNSQIMYRLEHLMEVGKRDSVDLFDREACSLYEDARQGFTKDMIQMVTRHYIISSKRLTGPVVQRLNSKIFNEGLKNTVMLRQIAKKEQ